MVRFLILVAAVVPPLLLLGYGVAKTRASWRSEAIWNAFMLGAVGAIAAAMIELAFSRIMPADPAYPLLSSAGRSIFVAALPEESIKFIVLLALAAQHVDARRLQDLVILSVAVSLGLATLENFFYVVSIGNWQATAALRAITSVPGHGIDGLAMGASLVAARMQPDKRWLLPAALIVPIALHASYDFPLFALGKSGADRDWLIGAWLVAVACSSLVVILICNHVLSRARAYDVKSGRDFDSVETSDWLIIGGAAALVGAPLVAALGYYAKGGDATATIAVLGILPVAFGIDAICTGLERRRERHAQHLRLSDTT
jgi:protease PrsW